MGIFAYSSESARFFFGKNGSENVCAIVAHRRSLWRRFTVCLDSSKQSFSSSPTRARNFWPFSISCLSSVTSSLCRAEIMHIHEPQLTINIAISVSWVRFGIGLCLNCSPAWPSPEPRPGQLSARTIVYYYPQSHRPYCRRRRQLQTKGLKWNGSVSLQALDAV